MATCKDCIQYEPCKDSYYNAEQLSRFPLGFLEKENAEKNCAFFKDRSKFIEQKHGFFLEDEDCYGETVYQCSNCGMYFSLIEGTPEENEYDYCPSCGAKMDELEQALKEREEE